MVVHELDERLYLLAVRAVCDGAGVPLPLDESGLFQLGKMGMIEVYCELFDLLVSRDEVGRAKFLFTTWVMLYQRRQNTTARGRTQTLKYLVEGPFFTLCVAVGASHGPVVTEHTSV
ncbi:hypothetical protein ACOZ4I_19495 (plasmid) [Haloarcula salina]|uniref:hypothetical protein n=1 Tax=Haloarcula salina TaxID=1429914 RepID=UPI003C6F957F